MANGVTVNKVKLTDIRNRSPQEIGNAIRAAAFDGERYWKQSFVTSPSPAGGPPGVDTGAARASIHTEQVNEFHWNIVGGVEYFLFLEFGTSKMAARPSAMPMAMWLQKNIDSYFQNIIF